MKQWEINLIKINPNQHLFWTENIEVKGKFSFCNYIRTHPDFTITIGRYGDYLFVIIIFFGVSEQTHNKW